MKVSLLRYREVPVLSRIIPERIPISESLFRKLYNFATDFLYLRCYFNTLIGIPDVHLLNGAEARRKWDTEFSGLNDEISIQLDKITQNESLLNTYYNRVHNMRTKYQEFNERYVFYRKLVDAQNSQTHGWSDSDSDYDTYASGGISSYTASQAVNSDYYSTKNGRIFSDMHLSEGADPRYSYTFTFSGNQTGTNWRYVWFEAHCHDTNHSKASDRDYPTTGTQKYKWVFDGGWWKRLEIFFKTDLILMPASKYPFAGLQ